MKFMETSAKANINVEEAFNAIARAIKDKMDLVTFATQFLFYPRPISRMLVNSHCSSLATFSRFGHTFAISTITVRFSNNI